MIHEQDNSNIGNGDHRVKQVLDTSKTRGDRFFDGLKDIGKFIISELEVDMAEIERRHGKNANFFTGITGTSAW